MARVRLGLAAFVAVITLTSTAYTAGEPDSTCLGRHVTIAGGGTLEGTDRDDVILAHRRATIDAGAGVDLVCTRGGYSEVYSGSGADRIDGGAGDDYFYEEAGEDVVSGGGGDDLITDTDASDDRYSGGAGRDGIRFSYPYGRLQPRIVVDLARGRARGHGRDRLSGFEYLEGTGRRDSIRGSGRPETLDGIRGGDRIVGRGGDDTIFGAALLVSEVGVIDRYDGADPALRGGVGDDRIFGGAGRDRLSGGPGDDLLDGGGPSLRPGDGGHGGPGKDRCLDLEAMRACERD